MLTKTKLACKVASSTAPDALAAGKEAAARAVAGLQNTKLMLAYASVAYDLDKMLEGIAQAAPGVPVLGNTSFTGIVTPEGFISGDAGFVGVMAFADEELRVGVAGSAKDGDARATGRKIALEAMKNAGKTTAPDYFYMAASPGEEEFYIKGISDIIGRVPFFGGSAADNSIAGEWSLYTGAGYFPDGAVAAFFWGAPMTNLFTGAYRETGDVGIITKVRDNRVLEEIDGVPALKKYAQWAGVDVETLKGGNLLVYTINSPLGVVACVIPFNFPCDLFDQKVAPALMAGNAVIVKPSTDNPLTLCILTELLVKAGVTDGAAQIITGRGSQVGRWLCANPDVSAITLTGSTEVGIETYKTGAAHLAHIALELGGNDAFIVLEDGDVDLAVEELIWGRMYNTGQVCCASKRFLIHNSLKDEFTAKAVERIKKIKRGDPADDDTQLGCLISEKAAIEVERQVNLTVEQGGRLVLGGRRDGAFYDPTVIADVPKTADVAKDMEIFGPVVPVIGFDTADEAVGIANASIFGLCGCVFSADMKKAWDVAQRLECGGVVLNGASFFRSFEMPFGGYKYSGVGTEGVLSTFDEVTHLKTIVLKNII